MQHTTNHHPHPPSSKASSKPPPPLDMKHNNQQQVFPPLNYSRSYFTQWLLQSAAAAEVVAASSSSTVDQPPRRVPLVLPPQLTNNHSFNSDSSSHPLQQQQPPPQQPPSVQNKKTNRMELIQLLAINALEFTAPVYSFLNKDTMTNSPSAAAAATSPQKQKAITTPPVPIPTAAASTAASSTSSSGVKHVPATRTNSSNSLTLTHHSNSELKLEREIIQLSGHPGSFAPAGPKSIWKKMPTDSLNEAEVYELLRDSPSESGFRSLAASYISRAEYKGQTFIELEDLVTRFSASVDSVSIMDLKLGTRTFLESEVQNQKPRSDLFEKLYKLDPSSLTEEELSRGWITKLRYMTFREELSSTRSLGFRIEGLKRNSSPHSATPTINFHRLRDPTEIQSLLTSFTSPYKDEYIRKLKSARAVLENSAFFRSHEMIGSSLLLIHDNEACGVWIIDFAKTVPATCELSHRAPWQLGNHEDGVLTGIDNIITLLLS